MTGATIRAAAWGALLAAAPGAAMADGAEGLIWRWSPDPFVWGLAALALWLWLRGLRGARLPAWRIALFSTGLGLTFLALASPLDHLAGHLYWVGQVQAMLLRLLGPLLMLAAQPQAVLAAGLPKALRRPLPGWLAGAGRVLGHPLVATLVLVAAPLIWAIPALQDAAVLGRPAASLMQLSMLGAGLVFFRVLFDPRDPPEGAGHGVRIAMLLAAAVATVLIGAAITLKPMPLYPAYDLAGRLFGWEAMGDEATGGFLIWVPSAMICLLAMLMVVHHWNGAEARRWAAAQGSGSNAAALLVPETAEELWIVVRPKNRRLGIGLGLVAISMFALILGIGIAVPTVERMQIAADSQAASAE